MPWQSLGRVSQLSPSISAKAGTPQFFRCSQAIPLRTSLARLRRVHLYPVMFSPPRAV